LSVPPVYSKCMHSQVPCAPAFVKLHLGRCMAGEKHQNGVQETVQTANPSNANRQSDQQELRYSYAIPDVSSELV
jgi:hypothetical protein